ncbi:GLPGLI family protein [Maribacter vaceletii]|uniref:GLPGLI family protein n=1 Tax=Maribacter vaceletii TaxID=1206816 RepID=A0A495DSW4_9FLAO|nr:GLPGLI family protein [Maribacter vaceletii]RKR07742.1 GLPGLI family protein [Maribacter vaceletii]
MKKNIFFIALLIMTSSYAQDFQGKAVYESKTSVDLSNFGRPDMPEEDKKRIKERIKRNFEKTFVLSFNKIEALYLEEKRLEQPGNNRGSFRGFAFNVSGKYYKNIKEEKYINQKEMFGKVFLIKDELPSLSWVMGSETKQIGQYLCYKATALKAVDPASVLNFRPPGRPGGNREQDAKKDSVSKENSLFKDKEKTKEIEVTAWYTLDIPISQGPGEYWGLPGLILEVNADKTTILCSKIIINSKDKEIIEAPKKGKEITQEKYNKVLKAKMKEFSERPRNGPGSRGGNRPRN